MNVLSAKHSLCFTSPTVVFCFFHTDFQMRDVCPSYWSEVQAVRGLGQVGFFGFHPMDLLPQSLYDLPGQPRTMLLSHPRLFLLWRSLHDLTGSVRKERKTEAEHANNLCKIEINEIQITDKRTIWRKKSHMIWFRQLTCTICVCPFRAAPCNAVSPREFLIACTSAP